jgi:DMSO/TMAO reductase YedYZ molybdopterin-dependent catalytic subunit
MPRDFKANFTRREWLSASILTGGAVFLGAESLWSSALASSSRDSQSKFPAQNEFPGGKQLGTAEFVGEPRVPLDTVLGSELDGRQYTDLSSLRLDVPVTPTEKFFIRTRASKLIDTSTPWSIRMSSGAHENIVTARDIVRESIPQGIHLMECAGNTKDSRFGMISVADWAGVPISKLSEWLHITDRATRILVSGFDSYSAPSVSSISGASWIFSWDDLLSSNAFLATKMNGQPLTPDHGAPVRLIVPGWYGCASIKWVNAISIVDAEAEATSQMKEYAFKTHQRGVPNLAHEFEPAKPDPAAVPIRVEKWIVNNQIKYRVVGIVWGGSQPVGELQIRFNPEEDFVAVENVQHTASDSWTFWTHTWAPRKPDTYILRLRVADPSVRTRRLDMGFYARTVRITDL